MTATFPVRPRVAALLEAAWSAAVTLVCAEAGYGKSAALASLTPSPGVAFVPVRAGDAAGLAASITAAAGARAGSTGAELARSIGADGRERLLVLDDVERVGSSAEAAHLLNAFIAAAPANLHLLISGRRLPAVGLDGIDTRARVYRITAADLAFTEDETAAVLGAVPAPVARRCHELSGGWPAAVALAARRLARSEPQLLARAGPLDDTLHASWHELARAIVTAQREPELLGVVAAAGGADPALLEHLGIRVAAAELSDLRDRGLLAGATDGLARIAPMLAAAAAELLDPATAETVRRSAAGWWERAGRPELALERLTGGGCAELSVFLLRCGHRLAAGGFADRVVAAARRCAPGEPQVAAVLADALWLTGDWDGAAAAFDRLVDPHGGALPASVAWRFGALLYLRGERARAEAVLVAARVADEEGADAALVAAWLAAARWRSGATEAAAADAETAMRLAQGCGHPGALAAAQVARALVCAARGDRHGNAQAYRAALRSAEQAQDAVQTGRIHANLASKALEEGEYRSAVASADRAVQAAELHLPIVGLALENKAEALIRLGRLDQARAAAAEAAEAYAASGALHGGGPQLLLGEVYRLRGDQVQARLAFERALLAARAAEDAHVISAACAGLAWVCAAEDPGSAADRAGQALTAASALERATALNAAAWVRLVGGDAATTGRLAEQAEAEAQRTDDRLALATALEIRAAASRPVNLELLRAAREIWTEVADPIAASRAALAIATVAGDHVAAGRARAELAELAAAPAVGVAGLLLAGEEQAEAASITTLGRFTVTVHGQPVPSAAWQSRKARELLKLLATRGGRAVSRESAADTLWPGEPYEATAPRLSVQLSRLRTILDPDRRHPSDHYLAADPVSVALRVERVHVDLVEFLASVAEGTRLAATGRWGEAEAELRHAEQLYVGDLLEDDRDADWAVERREQARTAAVTCARLLARGAARRGADEDTARWLLRLLEHDPYDEDAWTALIATGVRLRRHGEARQHYASYARRMAELDLTAPPFDELTDRVP